MSKVVADRENYFVEYVTRGDSGNNPETHGHWYDYIHVLDGEGTITYGGTQDGARDVGNAEIQGGNSQHGAKIITLHSGDRQVLPLSLPHLFGATFGQYLHLPDLQLINTGGTPTCRRRLVWPPHSRR